MEGASQVILRNENRLAGESLLVIDPLRDMLAGRLQRDGREVRLSTQDFAAFRWLEAAGFGASFEAVPEVRGEERTLVVNLPREKDRLVMLLHALAAGMSRTARLWLVGENRAGIRSSPRHLQSFFGAVELLDKARHCALYEAREPLSERPFELAEYEMRWSLKAAGRELRMLTLPGVFAHGRLDSGTEVLLEALAQLRPAGRVLDFACGSGVIGMAAMLADADLELSLLDSSALALESCRRSLRENALRATLLPSDGLSNLAGRYDWIVSNPPFHRGVRNDLGVAEDFFREAGTFLAENGKIVVVFNRHLPYQQWLQREFAQVDRLDANGGYAIVRASHPRPRCGNRA
jgi:16S rRNA (guanine1207-N2)-methyltransferase